MPETSPQHQISELILLHRKYRDRQALTLLLNHY